MKITWNLLELELAFTFCILVFCWGSWKLSSISGSATKQQTFVKKYSNDLFYFFLNNSALKYWMAEYHWIHNQETRSLFTTAVTHNDNVTLTKNTHTYMFPVEDWLSPSSFNPKLKWNQAEQRLRENRKSAKTHGTPLENHWQDRNGQTYATTLVWPIKYRPLTPQLWGWDSRSYIIHK